ncbi:MAG TPA: VWA domain-containing protein [Bryobacteraceae bacterium]|nr:VWA domain-containing protein [Bryobacteraceae bacterium]
MARSPSRRYALRLTAGAICALAKAQQATFSTGVNVVNVLVTVRDKQGQLVKGLAQNDFKLEEDGRTQPIRYFSAQADQPLMLGLLIDVSGSQRTVLAEQRRASQQFIDQVLRPQDRAFFVRFDRRIELLDNLSQLEIDPKESSARGTALYDAIVSAARGLADQPGRKALIVLSDGYDTSSSAPLSAAVETAQRADALIYSIRFLDRDVFAFQVPASQGGSPVPREGRKALERIARETGGSYFDLAAAETLEKIYSRIEDELRNQYSLGFTPVNPRPGYRKIRVSVKRKGVTVQARDGYFPAQ